MKENPLAAGGEGIERRIGTEPERFAAMRGARPRARIPVEASSDREWLAVPTAPSPAGYVTVTEAADGASAAGGC